MTPGALDAQGRPARPRNQPPSSLNEDVFETPTGYESDDLILACKDALKHGRVAAEHAVEMADAQLANEMLTEPARHRAAREGVFRLSKAAVAKFQSTIERLHAKVASLDEVLAGPKLPTGTHDIFEITSCRNALMAMEPARRRQIIIAALKSDSPSNLEVAVLRGPAFLSGLDDLEQQHFRLTWQHKRRPDEVARRQVYSDALEHAERGGKLLLAFSTSLYDSNKIAAGEARERVAKDLLASHAE